MSSRSNALQSPQICNSVSGLERARAHLPGWAGRLGAGAALLMATVGGRPAANATAANRGDAAIVALIQFPAVRITKSVRGVDGHSATRASERSDHINSELVWLEPWQTPRGGVAHLRSSSRAAGDAVALSCVADAGMRSSPPNVGIAPIASSLHVSTLASATLTLSEMHTAC
jgi:hypothetical protein